MHKNDATGSPTRFSPQPLLTKVLMSVKTEHGKQIKFDICFINSNTHLQPRAATKEEKSKTEVLTYEL